MIRTSVLSRFCGWFGFFSEGTDQMAASLFLSACVYRPEVTTWGEIFVPPLQMVII